MSTVSTLDMFNLAFFKKNITCDLLTSFDFSVKMAGVWPSSFSDGYRLRNPKDSLILPYGIANYSTVNSTM